MPAERRAVLLLLSLAVLGQGVRLWVTRPGAPPGDVQLLDSHAAGSPAGHRDSSAALARPLALGDRIDVDQASALELARLPHVGLTLAKAIIADREAHGPFGSLTALDRVPGIGPGLLGKIGASVTFSAPVGGSAAAASAGSPASGAVDLNSADSAALERLPGIGPYMAGRIVAYREKHGRFAAVDELVRVGGIGPATLGRVRERVRVE